eukprot:8226470-Alexandrium_andersonii.AAC.1
MPARVPAPRALRLPRATARGADRVGKLLLEMRPDARRAPVSCIADRQNLGGRPTRRARLPRAAYT